MANMRGERVLGASWLATVVAAALVVSAPAWPGLVEAPAGKGRAVSRPSDPAQRTIVAAETRRAEIEVASPAPEPSEQPAAPRFEPRMMVRVPRPIPAFARPHGGSRRVGTLVRSSKYYHVPLVAALERLSRDGRWGRVELPYAWPRRDGWIRLKGLHRSTTAVEVHVDLSKHRITVERRGRQMFWFRAAIGSPVSPTPPGEYFVTDRIPFSRGGTLGSFAFGISGIQPRLPTGWSGGNQLAIHGTSNPRSIGLSVSAGCVRVSEAALARLRPLLRLGTPVVITR